MSSVGTGLRSSDPLVLWAAQLPIEDKSMRFCLTMYLDSALLERREHVNETASMGSNAMVTK